MCSNGRCTPNTVRRSPSCLHPSSTSRDKLLTCCALSLVSHSSLLATHMLTRVRRPSTVALTQTSKQPSRAHAIDASCRPCLCCWHTGITHTKLHTPSSNLHLLQLSSSLHRACCRDPHVHSQTDALLQLWQRIEEHQRHDRVRRNAAEGGETGDEGARQASKEGAGAPTAREGVARGRARRGHTQAGRQAGRRRGAAHSTQGSTLSIIKPGPRKRCTCSGA